MTNIEKSKNSIYQKGFGWTYVGVEMASKHNTAAQTFVRKMKRRGECNCPRANMWYCDQNCFDCKYCCGFDDGSIEEVNERSDDNSGASRFIAFDSEVCDSDGNVSTFGDSIPSSEDTPEESYEKKEIAEALIHALGALDADEYELIRLAFVEGLSDSEIAGCMGIKARKTVNNRKLKILKKFGTQMKKFF